MTNEELAKIVQSSHAATTGALAAFMAAIKALQSQPGFNHASFVLSLAKLQVSLEDNLPPDAATKAQFAKTIEQFSSKQVPPLREGTGSCLYNWEGTGRACITVY